MLSNFRAAMLTVPLEKLTQEELDWLIAIICDHADHWSQRPKALQVRAVILRGQP